VAGELGFVGEGGCPGDGDVRFACSCCGICSYLGIGVVIWVSVIRLANFFSISFVSFALLISNNGCMHSVFRA